jgi:basic amino acid/polyamine antiporter, APA family
MIELKRSLRVRDGLAMVVGIMVGSGIFRTPGGVASQLGRPGLTLFAWLLGGVVAFMGSVIFAELATRYPQAGGKYVYAREAFGPRMGFVVGWVEAIIYIAAIAAIAVVCGEYLGRLVGAPDTAAQWLGVAVLVLFTAINLTGVASGRWVQNIATTLKIAGLVVVVIAAFARGSGIGWTSSLPTAPHGTALFGAMAVAFQAVVWSYYGYLDGGKIAEEVVDPSKSLPRIYLGGITLVTTLYLLLNAAYVHVLSLDQVAASKLVAADVMTALFGAAAGVVFVALSLLVVIASLNGNIFVTPRVLFGLAREGLGPAELAQVNKGGTPWAAMTWVGVAAMLLALTGTFEQLLSLTITLILVVDSIAVGSLVVARRRKPEAPFKTPLYPALPIVFVGVYAALFVGTAVAQPVVVIVSVGAIAVAYGLSVIYPSSQKRRQGRRGEDA